MGEGDEAQKSCSGGVSEGGLEPPRPMRALGPQPSASAYSATPTWRTWVRADCSKGAARGRGQAGRLTVARSRVSQGVRLTPWGPGLRTAAWCSVRRGGAGGSGVGGGGGGGGLAREWGLRLVEGGGAGGVVGGGAGLVALALG